MAGIGERPEAGAEGATAQEALDTLARLWADPGDDAAAGEALRLAAAAGDDEPAELVRRLRAEGGG